MTEKRGTFWGRLSLSQKIIIPTIVGFATITFALLFLLSYINVNTIIDAEDEQLNTAFAAFETVISDRSQSALALARSIAEQSAAQTAFAERDRETLAELYLPVYEAVDTDFDIPQAQFHLAPATSFLRLHDPTAFDDDLSTFRQTVVDTNALQQQVSGIEVGRGGPGIRGVVPVFHQGEHIGSFEIGINIDITTLEDLKAVYGGDWHIILNPRVASIATLEDFQITEPGPVENTLKYASTIDAYVPVSDMAIYNDVLTNGVTRIDRVQVGENNFAVFVAPLRDYRGNVIGAVQIDLNRNVVAAQISQTQLQAAALGLFITLVAAITIYFIIQRSLKPIRVLTAASNEIAQGNWDVHVDVKAHDEIGVLASAFSTMIGQVRHLLTGLENRVAARTADLETSAEIAAAANQVREMDDLISLTVNLVRDRFNFYYVQVYLTDPDNEWAVLKDGTGYVGRRLLVKEHRLPLDGHSLVARAINTGEVVIVQDTATDPDFLPNDLLPETKAEITIPLRTKNAVIGALDIQHNEVNAFDEAARQLFSTLAEQLAVTFENVQLFEDTERRARELETVADVSVEASTNLDMDELLQAVVNLTRDNFGLYHTHMYLLDENDMVLELAAGAGEIGRQMVAEGHKIPLDREHSLVARAARTRTAVIVNDVQQAPDFQPNRYLPNTRSEMAIPMVVGDNLIGVLDVQSDILNRFTDEDVRVKTTLALQVAVAIQNARSFAQTQAAAEEMDQQNRLMDAILSNSPAGLFVVEAPTGKPLLANQRATELLGKGIDPNATQTELAEVYAAYKLGTDDIYPTAELPIVRAMQGETSYIDDMEVRRPDGKRMLLEVAGAPIYASDGSISASVISFQDITERKALEQERIERSAQLAEALEVARMGYWEFDFETGNFTFNDHFYAMLGTTVEAEGGYEMAAEVYATKYVHPEDAPIVAANVQAAYETDDPNFSLQLEARNIRTDGSIMTVLVRLHAVKDETGKTIKMIGANQDITESKRQAELISKRAAELQTVAEVSTEAAANLDVDELLWSVSNLTKESFSLYHAHIYLLDEAGENLVLAAGAGEAGRQMVEKGHSIPIDREQSLVATAARTYEGVVVNDVTQTDGFMANPLLPDTRSEMAIPMLAGDSVIGVLDVQADITDRFTEEDVNVKTTLASQIAIAVQNARNFAQSNKQAHDLAIVTEVGTQTVSTLDPEQLLQEITEYVYKGFDLYHTHIFLLDETGQNLKIAGGAGPSGCKHVGTDYSVNIHEVDTPITRAARTLEGQINNDVLANPDYAADPNLPDLRAEMAIPMVVGGALIGVLEVHSTQVDRFSELDVQINSILASQLGVALRNAYLFHETQNSQAFMSTVINATPDLIYVKDRNFRYTLANEGYARITGREVDEVIGHDDLELGFSEELVFGNPEKGIHGFRADDMQVLTTGETLHNPYNVVRDRQGNMYILDTYKIPLHDAEGNITGVLAYSRDVTALHDAQAELQKRASELQTVAEVSAAATTNLNVDELLWSVSNLTKESFSLYHAHIYLLDEAGENLVLAAGAGKAGRQMVEKGHSIPIDREQSLVATAARTRKGVVVNDVTQTDGFMANPLLPDTRSEMAIPMLAGDEVIGVLDVQSDITDRFTEEDVNVKTTLASQIAIAVQNARSHEETQTALENIDRQNRLMDAILTNIPSGIFVVEAPSGTPVLANQRATELLGKGIDPNATQGELAEVYAAYKLGTDEVYPTEELPIVRGMQGESTAIDNMEVRRPDGKRMLLEVSGAPIKDAEGEVVASVISFQDITERRAQEEAMRQANQVIENSPTILFRWRAEDWGVELVTENVQSFGYTAQELLSGEVAYPTIVHPDDLERVAAEVAEYTKAGVESFTQEYRIITKDGGVRWTDDRTSIIRDADGNALYYEGVVIDITERREAEEEIRRQSAILENSRDFISMTDLEGNVIYLNPGGRDMVGVARDANIDGAAIATFHEPADLERIQSKGIPVAFEKGLWRGENRLKTQDGRLIPVDQTIFVIHDEAGNPQNLATIMTDIADRKAAEEQIRKRAAELQTVAEVSAEAATNLNVDDLLWSVSNLTKEAFGLYHAHIYLLDDAGENLLLTAGAGDAGQQMVSRGHSIPMERKDSLVARAARTEGGVVVNDVTKAPDFLPNPLLPDTRSEMAIPMMASGKVIGVLDVQSNIPDRFTEQDVQVKTTLATQIAIAIENARAYAYQQETAERLRDLDRLKSEFLANMSHELRTPLNSIIGYSEIMLDGIDGDLTEDAIEDVKAIHGSGQHLLNIINDILDLAKIEAGRMQMDRQDVNMVEFGREIMHAGEILVKDKPVDLVVEAEVDELHIYADPVRLRQIIWNIMSNAVKFTEQGSVTLAMGVSDDDAEMAYVRIADTGIGMNKEDLPEIFEQFRQVDGSSTRRAGGTGLGLNITRHLVHMHEGEITVDSELGVGTTFVVTFPLYDEAKVQENS